ncbi:phospholipase D-like domain-containing protein [Flavicella sediminum]|uniref:phospholipase D-like domain-containing protein n=1 Tax=Flavicella sediminum TaxID=2585141 RepID=UPI0011248146|nr:phospholipase D-like domain-containing protein [Flavicella sediminum]
MEQKVFKGSEIYDNLYKELGSAKKSIFIVVAWFTDVSLLELLAEKQKEGIEVRAFIGDNKDNNLIDYRVLTDVGGMVTKIKGKGFGMLHEKYCVIDETYAFHGSYNLTVNAKNNNSESVIFTNHKGTVEQLVSDFYSMEENNNIVLEEKKSFLDKFKKPKDVKVVSDAQKELKGIQVLLPKESAIERDIDEVFKSIISAEIKKTNRTEIKEMAYNQAQEVSGDSQNINKSMDSLYHLFISDKKENDDNKEVLFKKIEDKVSEFNQNIQNTKDANLHSVEIEINAEEKNLQLQKAEAEMRKSSKEALKKNISDISIASIHKTIESEKTKIDNLDVAFVKPIFKLHEFIPLVIIFSGLAFAMFLFYSSSAYIMLYAADDAIRDLSNGLNVNAQVYQADAISKSIGKGWSAVSYILFFVFIPFAVAYVAHDKKVLTDPDTEFSAKKIWVVFKNCTPYLVVIAIDTFIAIKVSKTIGQIEFLSKGIESTDSVFSDINFWLVFFLGAIPFFFLAELMNKLIVFFSERNEQAGRDKMRIEKKIANQKISKLEKEIDLHKKEIGDLDVEIVQVENEKLVLEQKLIFIPKELDVKNRQINEQASNDIATVRKKADVYKNDIENDNIQISLTSLKDRVSAFIEGWNQWLHDEYAIDKAVRKSEEAILQSDTWLNENMKKIAE